MKTHRDLVYKNNMTEQLPLNLPVRTAFGREDFLIGPSNEEAVGWIDRWPAWPMPALILYGPPASGKSHLAAVWQDRVQASALPDVETYAAHPTPVLIDPIEDVLAQPDGEEMLFHLYNLVREHKQTMLIVAHNPPAQMTFRVPDLASRLRACPAVAIHALDDDLLAALLVKLFSDRQMRVSPDVVRYLVSRMERSYAASRDLVAELDRLALSEKRAVTLALARELLS